MRQLAGGCRPRPREGPPSLILTAPHAAPLSSLELSLSSARVLHATQRAVFTAMILLDGLDKHDEQPSPKLVAEASSSSVPVTRPLTPTPSLPPDYESSQAQLRPTTLSYPEIQEKRTRRRRCRRYTIFALAAYFFLTVVIGLPILVVVSTPHQFPSSHLHESKTVRWFFRNSRRTRRLSSQIPTRLGERTTRQVHRPILSPLVMHRCGYRRPSRVMLGM